MWLKIVHEILLEVLEDEKYTPHPLPPDGLPVQLYLVAHARDDSVLLEQMWGEQLSPQNGISGPLKLNIFDLLLHFISGRRVSICPWGGSRVTMSEADWIKMNLSPCL